LTDRFVDAGDGHFTVPALVVFCRLELSARGAQEAKALAHVRLLRPGYGKSLAKD
jgi:hypothetical protein